MGHVTQRYALSKTLCVFTVEGELTMQQILQTLRSASSLVPAHLVLWDFTHGTLRFNLSREPQGPLNSPSGSKPSAANGKTAVVCPKELDFGLYRILQVFSVVHNYPTGLRIFRKMKRASRWLGLCDICLKANTDRDTIDLPCRQHCPYLSQNSVNQSQMI
jgi:hypothetical protein